jgi:predicted DsbA family dithiol-disulfide isomerase
METVLEESGAKEGLKFAFDRIRRIPNTLKAHRLMRLAARSQRDDALAEELFAAYFEHGEDIGAEGTLIACAAAAGLEPDRAADFLHGDEDQQAVAAMDQLARQGGIAGVPYFIFDRRYALAGAQEPASFLPLFDALMEAEGGMLASSA